MCLQDMAALWWQQLRICAKTCKKAKLEKAEPIERTRLEVGC